MAIQQCSKNESGNVVQRLFIQAPTKFLVHVSKVSASTRNGHLDIVVAFGRAIRIRIL